MARFSMLLTWMVLVLQSSLVAAQTTASSPRQVDTPIPARAKSISLSAIDGQVDNVGSGKDNGVLRLSGTLRGAGSVDLSSATLWITDLLGEGGGAGELMRDSREKVLPLYLIAGKGSKAASATFESNNAPGTGPTVTVTVAQSGANPNDLDFTVKVDRAVIPAPRLCGAVGSTRLHTRFALTDSAHRRVRLSTRQNWQCTKNQLKNPTVSTSPPPPDAGVPEDTLTSMAVNLALDVASDEITATLFPSSGTAFDYQTLLTDFQDIIDTAILDAKIQTDEAGVQGFLNTLNGQETLYTHGQSASATFDTVSASLTDINNWVAQLQSDGPTALAGWVSGAQTHLSTLQFLQQLQNTIDPTNLSYNALFASTLNTYLQYLVTTRAFVLHQNVVGSLNGCYKYTNPGQVVTYNFKNCDGSTYEQNGVNQCELRLILNENTSCAQPELTDQTNELYWMDQIIQQWRASLANMATSPNGKPLLDPASLPCATCQDAYSAITVQSVAGMLTVVQDGSLTADNNDRGQASDTTAWVKAACDGLQICDYQLQSANFMQSPGELHSVTVTYTCASDTTPHVASLADVGDPKPALYDGAYLHLDCAPRVANLQASVQNQAVAVGDSSLDVSTDSQRPNAGKITSGSPAPAGTSGSDTNWAIILPHNGVFGALTVDLGATMNVCGNGFDCLNGPMIQADNDDNYELDYSTDGVQWTTYGQFQTVSSSGLRTRGTLNCGQANAPPCDSKGHSVSFSARYVRVFAVSGGNTFSVSQLTLWNTGSSVISVGKSAWGPEPLITNGQIPPDGTTWNDSVYAVVFPTVGPAGAAVIDLGEFHRAIEQVFRAQASGDDSYQVDVSGDGAVWFNFYSVPPLSSNSGLQSRESPVLPPSAGRYVRIYPTHGVDFSV